MVRKHLTFKIGSLDNLEGQDVMSLLDNLMKHTCDLTKKNLQSEIDRAVPKDTGLLRQTLQASLQNSEYDGSRVHIHMKPTDYGKYVDEYTTSQVRHDVDPEAVGHYAQHLAKEAKFRLHLNWEISKINLRAN